jgi:hypothetical protein
VVVRRVAHACVCVPRAHALKEVPRCVPVCCALAVCSYSLARERLLQMSRPGDMSETRSLGACAVELRQRQIIVEGKQQGGPDFDYIERMSVYTPCRRVRVCGAFPLLLPPSRTPSSFL